jgi:hypothetical protein
LILIQAAGVPYFQIVPITGASQKSAETIQRPSYIPASLKRASIYCIYRRTSISGTKKRTDNFLLRQFFPLKVVK